MFAVYSFASGVLLSAALEPIGLWFAAPLAIALLIYTVEKFGKLAEAYAGGKISEADFTRIQSSVEGAMKSASDGSDPKGNSQADVVKAINRSFASLDTVARSIIESKQTPVDVKINTKIELTPEALQYLRIGETFQRMMNDDKKKPPVTGGK